MPAGTALVCSDIERYLGEEEERVHALRGISLTLEAGTVGAGDVIELLSRAEDSLSIATVFELYAHGSTDRDLLARAARLAGLPASWRKHFRELLAALSD